MMIERLVQSLVGAAIAVVVSGLVVLYSVNPGGVSLLPVVSFAVLLILSCVVGFVTRKGQSSFMKSFLLMTVVLSSLGVIVGVWLRFQG